VSWCGVLQSMASLCWAVCRLDDTCLTCQSMCDRMNGENRPTFVFTSLFSVIRPCTQTIQRGGLSTDRKAIYLILSSCPSSLLPSPIAAGVLRAAGHPPRGWVVRTSQRRQPWDRYIDRWDGGTPPTPPYLGAPLAAGGSGPLAPPQPPRPHKHPQKCVCRPAGPRHIIGTDQGHQYRRPLGGEAIWASGARTGMM